MNMPHLVKIGNSQGIRIPKPYIEQAHLEGQELKIQLVNGGLLVSPVKNARQGWQESIEKLLATQDAEPIDKEWLNASLISDDEVE